MYSLGPQHDPIPLPAGFTDDLDPRQGTGNVTIMLKFAAHASGSTLTGLDVAALDPGDGDFLILRNTSGSGTLTVASGSNRSLLANRIYSASGADVSIAPGGTAFLMWVDGRLDITTGPIGSVGATGPQGP